MPNDKLAITYTADSLGKIGDITYVNDEGKLAFFDGGLRRMNLDGTLEYDLKKRATISADGQKKCIGIVFSNKTSAIDYAKGYTKGYVMALKDTKSKTGDNARWKTENTQTFQSKKARLALL